MTIDMGNLEHSRTRATSARLLLLIGDRQNRAMLADWLAPAYEVVVATGAEALEEPFDLCLVDETSFPRFRDRLADRKAEESPVFLPYLLTVPARSIDHATVPWEDVDEVVTRPVKKAVLHGRIDGLLERRQLSTELAHEKAQSRRRFRVLFETGPDPVFVLGSDDRILAVSGAFVELTDRDTASLVGRTLDDIDAFPAETVAALTDTHDGDTVTVSYTAPDGTTRFAEVATSRTSTDCETGELVGVLRDVTERRQRKRELERQNQRLDEFASILAHELRNPLGIAQMYLTIARTGDEPAFEQIADAHERIEEMIDTLLDLARRGETVGETELLSLTGVVEEAWLAVDTADATLNSEVTDRWVHADPDRLLEVFENLFRNSVEHGDGDATITVGSLPDGFYVADDGPGIPADQREVIFERGYSAADAGVGIGLTIVQRVVEAHSWTVSVGESEADGARFEVRDVTFDAPGG